MSAGRGKGVVCGKGGVREGRCSVWGGKGVDCAEG